MPLKKGKSKKIISSNIKELIRSTSSKRSKAIKTLAKKKGISTSKAKRKQAVAIALKAAGKARK